MPNPDELHLQFPRCANCNHLRGGHRPAMTGGCLVVLVTPHEGQDSTETRCGCAEFIGPPVGSLGR